MNAREEKILSALDNLVRLGRNNGELLGEVNGLPSPSAFGIFWQRWQEILGFWNPDDLQDLIKGFVYYEMLPPANGFGSVPPVPQIFSIYLSKVSREQSNSLADWILAHTVNEYCPYGTNNHGARSLKELEQINKQRNQKKLEMFSREQERENHAKAKRAHDATLRLPKAVKRNDINAVVALIAKGANPDSVGDDGLTARQIAKELGRELLFQPIETLKA
jgi:hypothetical protein